MPIPKKIIVLDDMGISGSDGVNRMGTIFFLRAAIGSGGTMRGGGVSMPPVPPARPIRAGGDKSPCGCVVAAWGFCRPGQQIASGLDTCEAPPRSDGLVITFLSHVSLVGIRGEERLQGALRPTDFDLREGLATSESKRGMATSLRGQAN